MIANDIKQYRLDRVIVTACSLLCMRKPSAKLWNAGWINTCDYRYIREQLSWVTQISKKNIKSQSALKWCGLSRTAFGAADRAYHWRNPDVMVVAAVSPEFRQLGTCQYRQKSLFVEKNSTIGGHMAQFDKHSTLDCSACILTLNDAVLQHRTFKCSTYCEVTKSKVSGQTLISPLNRRRYVDHSKCNACLACTEKCPGKGGFRVGWRFGEEKSHLHSLPAGCAAKPIIDRESCTYFIKGKCKLCQKVCEQKAYWLWTAGYLLHCESWSVIIATGYNLWIRNRWFNTLCKYPAFTVLWKWKDCSIPGPTAARSRSEMVGTKSIAILHCIGSRDKIIVSIAAACAVCIR